jgi:phospholipid/cholesterol/gamma-HCH transport system substrate-binding protein
MMSSKAVGAGAFVLLGAALFTIALFMIGERRMLFTSRYTVYTEYSRLGQLETGAVVRVSGIDAGEVTEIEIPDSPSQPFRVRMEVREDVRQLVRADSVATPQTEGLVGSIFVNIAAGTEGAPIVEDGGTIRGQDPFQIADLLQQASASVALITETVDALRGDAERAVQEIAATAEETHALVEDLRPDILAMAANGNRITADTSQIIASINEGRGTIGKLVNDDALYDEVRRIAEEARGVMVNVRAASDEARGAIADFRSPDGATQGLMADMRVTLAQAREATGDLADNMEAMKRNFLLRGFFNRRGYFDLDDISPMDYRSGVLENGRRKAMRIWLSSAFLFERLPDGREVLSAGGRARIASAMATYLRYVPANPIVVEGYATEGSVSDQFQRSRARASLVREHVLNQYELAPQHTGYIALAADAPGSPADDRWDGVAITLFLDREALQFAPQPATP